MISTAHLGDNNLMEMGLKQEVNLLSGTTLQEFKIVNKNYGIV